MLDLPRHYLTHRWRRNHASSPPSRINNMCPGTSTSLTPWQYGQKAMIPCQHPRAFPLEPCPLPDSLKRVRRDSAVPGAPQQPTYRSFPSPRDPAVEVCSYQIARGLSTGWPFEYPMRVTSTQGSLRQTCARGEARGCGATVVFFCRNFPSVIGNTNGFSPSICE